MNNFGNTLAEQIMLTGLDKLVKSVNDYLTNYANDDSKQYCVYVSGGVNKIIEVKTTEGKIYPLMDAHTKTLVDSIHLFYHCYRTKTIDKLVMHVDCRLTTYNPIVLITCRSTILDRFELKYIRRQENVKLMECVDNLIRPFSGRMSLEEKQEPLLDVKFKKNIPDKINQWVETYNSGLLAKLCLAMTSDTWAPKTVDAFVKCFPMLYDNILTNRLHVRDLVDDILPIMQQQYHEQTIDFFNELQEKINEQKR